MYARGGSTPPARTSKKEPESLEFQRFRLFYYVTKSQLVTKMVTKVLQLTLIEKIKTRENAIRPKKLGKRSTRDSNRRKTNET